MYFSNMFCYGQDPNQVGITGIVGCIGVVYVSPTAMYAIHIPDGGPTENLGAGRTFADWVGTFENNTNAGHLFVFSNGTNRSLTGANYSSTEQEAKAIKKRLGGPKTRVYRMMQHLGPNSGTAAANSAAIFVERVNVSTTNKAGVALWFKQDFGKIVWVAGGSAETAQYKNRPNYCGAKIPSDMNSGWWRMDANNCRIAKI